MLIDFIYDCVVRFSAWFIENKALAGSFFASVVALLISIRTYMWRVSDANSRHYHSIVDDFWFRKVIAPSILDPIKTFVDEILDVVENIEANRSSLTPVDLKVELEKVQVKIRSLSRVLARTALIDQNLTEQFESRLQVIEDRLTVYIFAIKVSDIPSDYSSLTNYVGQYWVGVVSELQAKHIEQFPKT